MERKGSILFPRVFTRMWLCPVRPNSVAVVISKGNCKHRAKSREIHSYIPNRHLGPQSTYAWGPRIKIAVAVLHALTSSSLSAIDVVQVNTLAIRHGSTVRSSHSQQTQTASFSRWHLCLTLFSALELLYMPYT